MLRCRELPGSQAELFKHRWIQHLLILRCREFVGTQAQLRWRDGFLRKSEDKAGRTSMIATSMDPDLYKAITDRDIDLIQKRRHDMELSPLYDKTPELNTILHLAAANSDDEKFVQAILRI